MLIMERVIKLSYITVSRGQNKLCMLRGAMLFGLKNVSNTSNKILRDSYMSPDIIKIVKFESL